MAANTSTGLKAWRNWITRARKMPMTEMPMTMAMLRKLFCCRR
jgi:hypothetical protein